MNKENKYYVYGHYYKENNELFYIGKGTRDRCSAKGNRSKAWLKTTEINSWYFKILHDGLSFNEALDVESELIKDNLGILINHSIESDTKVNLSILSERLFYDPSSPTCLRWKESRGKFNIQAGTFKFRNGSKVGIELTLNGKQLQTHRVIWYLSTGMYPEKDMVIDHVDGDSHNNLLSNLRLVDHKTNAENRCIQKNNKSGVVGVYKMNNGYGKNYIVSKVTINGKSKQKYFDAQDNQQEAFRLACEWRKEQIRLLNEQGAGYTERHGT